MCRSPNYMLWLGEYTKNDRPKFHFCGHHEYKRIQDLVLEQKLPFIQVPCGKCLECRIQYARNWADRCTLEAKQYDHNYFVTLTYDDAHLPPKGSLVKQDLKDFIKRLRKKFNRDFKFKGKIRMFCCGEYGDQSLRPHYHLILFNLPLFDLSYSFYQEIDGKMVRYERPPSKNNDLMFSQVIYDLWRETDAKRIDALGLHKGMISVGKFSYDTAAYVSQYVTKKIDPDKDKKIFYKELGIEPEFLMVSNHPGIGAKFFQDHPLLHYDGKLVIPGNGEAHLAAVPRYYDKLFQKKYGEECFHPIQVERSTKKMLNFEKDKNLGINKDQQANLKDLVLKKIHHLKKFI